MGRADYLALGDWNCVCYQCGRKRKASTMKRHWQGYWVCPEHWEPRQTQDFVRAVPDKQTPPWIQPKADTFAAFCTPEGMTGISDYAVANCAIADFVASEFDGLLAPPICIPIYILVDRTIAGNDFEWACGSLVVDASLTLNGTVGVY